MSFAKDKLRVRGKFFHFENKNIFLLKWKTINFFVLN